MATLGNTSKPMNMGEIWGLNTNNQQGQILYLPGGGPWRITALGGWLAGSNSAPGAHLCLWDINGNLLRASGWFQLGSQPAVHGAWDWYEASIAPIDLAGGTGVIVGWSRDPGGAHQFGKYAGGGHYDGTQFGWPGAGFDVFDSSGEISAWLHYEVANNAPGAPTGLSPTGGATVNSGRTISYAWNHNDPDGPGDFNTSGWRLYDPAGNIIDQVSGHAATSLQRTLPAGYDANAQYSFDVRTSDKALAVSPWSARSYFRPNSIPNAWQPNGVATNTLVPTLSGGFSVPDPGDTLGAFQYHVVRAADWGINYTSPVIGGSGSAWSAVYGGPALAWNTQYAVRVNMRDAQGAWGGWSAWTYWTTVEPTAGAPTISPNTVATRQLTLTPTLNLQHAQAFDNYEIQINTPGGPVVQTLGPIADFAAVVNRDVVTTALTPGQEYHWRARVKRDSDNIWSAWSGYAAFKINAYPTGSTSTILNAISAAGVLVTTDANPVVRALFADPDRVPYGDTPSTRRMEVRRVDTQAALAGYPRASDPNTEADHALTTSPTLDVVYEVRVGFRDNAGMPTADPVMGPWRQFKRSALPVVALTAPAHNTEITDSTPLLDWTYAGSGGKAQASYRVRVFDKGPTGAPVEEVQVHDSGVRASADTQYLLPHGIIATGRRYRWSVTVTDTDGLSQELA